MKKNSLKNSSWNGLRSGTQNKLKEWLQELAQEATPDIDDCVAMLGESIGWLQQLKNTPQDPEWHGEGDVHIHTGMVLDELYLLLQSEAKHIQGAPRQSLILGALLHDVGKTVRTKEIEVKGVLRVASPKHESIGRSYLAFKLMALDLPFEVVWNVLGLVGEHHMPKLLVVRNGLKGEYLSLSRRADIELLYWLEVADMRGRICPDLKTQLTYLEEFKLFAEEYLIWKSEFPLSDQLNEAAEFEAADLASDSAKAYIYSHALRGLEEDLISLPVEAVAKSYEYKNNYSNLIVLCGPSGSGKSSWVAQNYPDYQLVSLDELRDEINGSRTSQKNKGQIIQLAKEKLRACLRDQQNVVWDATNLRSDFRKIICDFGRDYHALVTMIVFLLPETSLFQGNKSREFAVPDNVLQKQLEDYQFPLVNEAHRMQVVGEGGKLLYRSGYFRLKVAEEQ